MTYFVSLKWTAIIIGLLAIAGHLPPALAPARFGPILKSLPRNYPLGVVLMLAATLWFVVLTGVMDLGEISSARLQLMAAWAIAGVLVVIFVPGFLAARVIKILAYWWVIGGMVLVYSPHLWRDAIVYVTTTPERLRLFSWPGVVFGLVLIALGIFVYP
jgi:uncharacterized protein YjeT (DUF2065 family)